MNTKTKNCGILPDSEFHIETIIVNNKKELKLYIHRSLIKETFIGNNKIITYPNMYIFNCNSVRFECISPDYVGDEEIYYFDQDQSKPIRNNKIHMKMMKMSKNSNSIRFDSSPIHLVKKGGK